MLIMDSSDAKEGNIAIRWFEDKSNLYTLIQIPRIDSILSWDWEYA